MAKSANSYVTSKFERAKKVIQVLLDHGFQAMLVGGCVRDRLLGIEPKDYDVATDAVPTEVERVFSGRPYKTLRTGFEHGTLTVVLNHDLIEITTLRADVETDGRRAKVVFGHDFQDDSARRDFTINAMYEDIHGKIFDFFDGQKHLKEKKLLFVGDPKTRIKEDYLRILRFFRFQIRLGFQTDQKTLKALAELKDGLSSISHERILSEVTQIFSCQHTAHSYEDFWKTGVWAVVFKPFMASNEGIFKDLRSSVAQVSQFPISETEQFVAKLSVMILHTGYGESLDRWRESVLFEKLKDFKLSKAQIKKIIMSVLGLQHLKEIRATTSAALNFINTCETFGGQDSFKLYFFPFWSGVITELKAFLPEQEALDHLYKTEKTYGFRRKAKLPVSGHDLIKIFSLESHESLGDILDFLKETYYDGVWVKPSEAIDLLKSTKKFPYLG